MPSSGLSFKFQTHITIQKLPNISENSSHFCSSLPLSHQNLCLLPFTNQIKWHPYTPSCPSQKQSHCPLSVLSDLNNPHDQSLLLQEFWNLFSLSFTSTPVPVQAPAFSLQSYCSNLLTGLPVLVLILQQPVSPL